MIASMVQRGVWLVCLALCAAAPVEAAFPFNYLPADPP